MECLILLVINCGLVIGIRLLHLQSVLKVHDSNSHLRTASIGWSAIRLDPWSTARCITRAPQRDVRTVDGAR